MRREYWLLLALAGILTMLPLGPAQLALLLTVPGFALLVLARERLTAVELAAYSPTISIMAFPLAVLIAYFAGAWHAAPVLLGLVAIAVAAYKYYKNSGIGLAPSKYQGAVLAVALLVFIVVLCLTLKTFALTPAGFVCSTTHASDLNFHLSIAQHYIEDPSIPLDDPYLPGYGIVYNWFMHLLFGELGLLTGVGLFAIFDLLVPLVSALVFLDAFLLAEFLFGSERDGLVAALVYVGASGLSWAYIAYQVLVLHNAAPDIFKELVYEWPGIVQVVPGVDFTMMLKYDPTALFFFLPQTQTFGLMGMAFGFLAFLRAVRDRSWPYAMIAAIVLPSLVLFHMITAFPVFLALGLAFLYLLLRRRYRDALLAAVPLAAAAIASLYQLSLLASGNAAQIVIAHHPDVVPTLILSIGLLVPFAILGMYWKRNDAACGLLAAFAAIDVLLLNAVEMPATVNTYRFLVYAALPVSLFSGLVFSRWLASRSAWRIAVAAAVLLLMVPSTVILVEYYDSSSYVHATIAEYRALEWVAANTPADAVVFEEPGFFPRVPVLTGRAVAYAGEIYTIQYHNVDLQADAYGILGVTDSETLRQRLLEYNVSYVFVGQREATHPFTSALTDARYFQPVYDEEGAKVYKLIGG